MSGEAYSQTNSRGVTYYLHTKEVTLRGGRQQRIYYFAREIDAEFALPAIPEGYEVIENDRTGLLMLRRAQ